MEPSSDNIFIEIDNVSKRYGSNTALSGISLSIKRGEFFTLLGPSGCGKTTLLRLIAGFISPDEGSIILDGEDISTTPPQRRGVGLVFQNYALFPHMTVYKNLAFGLELRKLSEAEVGDRVRKFLELVRLSGMESRYPRQLSGGQQQRVALARSLIVEPKVILLDEPLSNLDFKLRLEMQTELASILKEVGTTSIYVTHDQSEALTLSDRVAVMNKGAVVQVGSPFEIYQRPKDRFVADFIGESNFFECTVEQVDPAVHLRTKEGLRIVSLQRTEDASTIGQNVFVALRPERVRLSKEKTTSPNCFGGKVSNWQYRGSLIRYSVNLGDCEVTVHQPAGDEMPIERGSSVFVSWAAEDCFIIPS